MAIESSTQDPGLVLTQVSSALEESEATLLAKLQTIRDKRHSLRVVIELFADAPSYANPVSTPVQPLSPARDIKPQTDSSTAEPQAASPAAEPQTESPEPLESLESPEPPKLSELPELTDASASESAVAKPAPAAEPKWQDYVSPEFQDVSFPKAVEFILVEHFDEGVDVATIMDELFVDDIPDAARRKGRNRLSNVLAVGLQNRKWHRSKAGAYTISRPAANAS